VDRANSVTRAGGGTSNARIRRGRTRAQCTAHRPGVVVAVVADDDTLEVVANIVFCDTASDDDNDDDVEMLLAVRHRRRFFGSAEDLSGSGRLSIHVGVVEVVAGLEISFSKSTLPSLSELLLLLLLLLSL
jgi:hypothetical protein